MKLESIVRELDAAEDAMADDNLEKAGGILRDLRQKVDSERHYRDAFSILVYQARKDWATSRYRHRMHREKTEEDAHAYYEQAQAMGYEGSEEEWRQLIRVPFRDKAVGD